jgi:hypothetical protein
MVNGRLPKPDDEPISEGAKTARQLVKGVMFAMDQQRKLFSDQRAKLESDQVARDTEQARAITESVRLIADKIQIETNKRHDHHHAHKIEIDNPAPTVNNEIRVDASPIADVIESIDQRAELAAVTRALLTGSERQAKRSDELILLRKADLELRERELAQAARNEVASLAVAGAIEMAAGLIAGAMGKPRRIDISRDQSGKITGGESRPRG